MSTIADPSDPPTVGDGVSLSAAQHQMRLSQKLSFPTHKNSEFAQFTAFTIKLTLNVANLMSTGDVPLIEIDMNKKLYIFAYNSGSKLGLRFKKDLATTLLTMDTACNFAVGSTTDIFLSLTFLGAEKFVYGTNEGGNFCSGIGDAS